MRDKFWGGLDVRAPKREDKKQELRPDVFTLDPQPRWKLTIFNRGTEQGHRLLEPNTGNAVSVTGRLTEERVPRTACVSLGLMNTFVPRPSK